MKGFDLPITVNIPVEDQKNIEERYQKDVTYAMLRERKIVKTWRKLDSNLRKIGDYILQHFEEIISYQQIKESLGIPEGSIKQIIGDLNFWREYPVRIIPHKKGFIKSSLKDPEDTEKYLRRKSRTITSMEQVYENIDTAIKVKQKKKIKIKKRKEN